MSSSRQQSATLLALRGASPKVRAVLQMANPSPLVFEPRTHCQASRINPLFLVTSGMGLPFPSASTPFLVLASTPGH